MTSVNSQLSDDQISALNAELWSRMFNSDFGRHYYDQVTSSLRQKDKALQLFIASFSLIGVGTLMFWSGAQQPGCLLQVSQFFLIVGAIGAFLRPYIKWDEEANAAQQMYMRYNNLYHGWLADWRAFTTNPDSAALAAAMDSHYRLLEVVDTFEILGQNKKLADKVYAELVAFYEKTKSG